MSSNQLAYGGCLLRFEINGKGYVQIEIFGYDSSKENFENVIEKPLIPSLTMTLKQCTVVSSSLIDKGLLVLLHLITSNSSTILLFLQLQSRPWSCQIRHTQSIPSTISGPLRFLSTNNCRSLFLPNQSNLNGFYQIDLGENSLKQLEFVSCSLTTYFYCYLKENFYWLMGCESEQKMIKVYYSSSSWPSKTLISFDTNQLFPLMLLDNVQTVFVVSHQIQLKTRSILGDLIVSTVDHRIFTSHHGQILNEISMNYLIKTIEFYENIEDEKLFLFISDDLQSIDIYQYESNFTLTRYINTPETAEQILIDDFSQIGWKQILFIKDRFRLDSFFLTDFSQIHVFQHGSHGDFHHDEKLFTAEINDENDLQTSLAIAQDILRKKLITADFIVNQSYFQSRQITNEIRRISSQNRIENLQSQSNSLTESTASLQLIQFNWFVYRRILYIDVKIRNPTSSSVNGISLFAIDRNATKMKSFELKLGNEQFCSDQTTFDCPSFSSLTLILTTNIEFDREMNFDLFLLLNETEKLFRLRSIHLTLDDLINSKSRRILKFDSDRNSLIYFNTFSRLDLIVESTSKFQLLENFRQVLLNIGFQPIPNVSGGYLLNDEENLFEHALVHLVNENEILVEELIVHFYAENSYQSAMLSKYILSKIDFQSFSLVESNESSLECFGNELKFYLDELKQIPTILRKVTPTSKSEQYRLFKLENFQSFQKARYQTDLSMVSSILH